jgi:hypothetical protein
LSIGEMQPGSPDQALYGWLILAAALAGHRTTTRGLTIVGIEASVDTVRAAARDVSERYSTETPDYEWTDPLVESHRIRARLGAGLAPSDVRALEEWAAAVGDESVARAADALPRILRQDEPAVRMLARRLPAPYADGTSSDEDSWDMWFAREHVGFDPDTAVRALEDVSRLLEFRRLVATLSPAERQPIHDAIRRAARERQLPVDVVDAILD